MIKSILISIFVLVLTLQISGQNKKDVTPFPHPYTPGSPTDMWDVKFNWDAVTQTGDYFNAGVVYIPTLERFWTSRWNSAMIHVWTKEGAVIDSFALAAAGTRGMTFDGQYVYCAQNHNTIQKIDPATRNIVGTITISNTVVDGARFIAFDPSANNNAGGFWVGNWVEPNYDLYLIDRSGTVLRTLQNEQSSIYGITYDNVSSGGPYLWIFTQGNGAGYPQVIKQILLSNGSYTSVDHDVLLDIGIGQTNAIAGGLFFTKDFFTDDVILGGILQGDPDRLFSYSIQGATGINDAGNSPVNFELLQNYPNPFNPGTKISFSLPTDSKVTLKVYDLLGQQIAILFNGLMSRGKHTVNFNANNLPSGMYLYKIETNDFVSVKKMLLNK